MVRKAVCKERLLITKPYQMTTQVTISRREHRYKLALRDRQVARGRREDTGILLPILTWGWNVAEEYRVNEGLPREGERRLQEEKA